MRSVSLIQLQIPAHVTSDIRALFEPFSFGAGMAGLLEGMSPGTVHVDQLEAPTVGIASTAEGVYLAGGASHREIREAVRLVFEKRLLTGELLVKDRSSIYLSVHPEEWTRHLGLLVPDATSHPTERIHYLCRTVSLDWGSRIPDGYSIQAIDRALLERRDIHELLASQLPVNRLWGSIDGLLGQAVGFAALRFDEVVAWCTPDCIGGGRIDFACATHPDHRRRGLASTVTAASVEAALDRGFEAAGWMCAATNEGSRKTAERVGFVRQAEFDEYFYRTRASSSA